MLSSPTFLWHLGILESSGGYFRTSDLSESLGGSGVRVGRFVGSILESHELGWPGFSEAHDVLLFLDCVN